MLKSLATAVILTAPPALASPTWGPRVEWQDEGPIAREHAAVMVFGQTVVVYAGSGYSPQQTPLGDAWAFDTADHTWRELGIEGDAPTPGGSKRVAQTPGDDHAFLFGGYDQSFTCNNDLHRAELAGDVLRFTRIEQETPPPGRALHAFAHDPQTGRFVAALGVSNQGFRPGTWIGETNDDDAVVWRELDADDAPSPRFGFAYGFDSDTGTLALLSGQCEPAPDNPMRMTDELWTLDCRADRPAWALAPIEDLPAGRRNPCFAFDDETDTLLVWCGTADARTNVPGLVCVRRDDEGAWAITQTDDEGFPPRRSSGFGYADPASDAIVVGFGNSAEGTYTDWVTITPP